MAAKNSRSKDKRKIKAKEAWCGLSMDGKYLLAGTCLGYTRECAKASAREHGFHEDNRRFIPVLIVPNPKKSAPRKGKR